MFGFASFSSFSFAASSEDRTPGTSNGEVFYFSLGIRATTEPEVTIVSKHEKNLEVDMTKQFSLEIE